MSDMNRFPEYRAYRIDSRANSGSVVPRVIVSFLALAALTDEGVAEMPRRGGQSSFICSISFEVGAFWTRR